MSEAPEYASGLVRRQVTQGIEMIALRLREEPAAEQQEEYKTKALFYLAGALEALEVYWDGRGVIPSSR